MVSEGSNLEEENKSDGIFNKYSVGNLENTEIHKDDERLVLAVWRFPSCLRRPAVYARLSPGPRRRRLAMPSDGLRNHELSSSAWNSIPEVTVSSSPSVLTPQSL